MREREWWAIQPKVFRLAPGSLAAPPSVPKQRLQPLDWHSWGMSHDARHYTALLRAPTHGASARKASTHKEGPGRESHILQLQPYADAGARKALSFIGDRASPPVVFAGS